MRIDKKTIHLREDETEDLARELRSNSELAYAHVAHGTLLPPNQSLINVAWKKRGAVRSNLVTLANSGFYVYSVRDRQTTLMVRHSAVPRIWPKVKSGQFSVSDRGLIYSVEGPLISSVRPNLLVIFSSMAKNIFSPFLMRHFEQNFSTIQKYVPQNTAVLRIADLGGVVGAFYMDTVALPQNETNVQTLVARVAAQIGAQNIVLYGGSKGGTAALYHSLLGGYVGVCVDPIVSDAYYVTHYNDSHFTEGIFPMRKEEKFAKLLQTTSARGFTGTSIICSDRSPQHSYIAEVVVREFGHIFSIFNSQNPNIKTHPDVARNSIPATVMLINMGLMGVPASVPYREIF